MIRLLGILIVLVFAGLGALFVYYGTTDPCEMLAKEQDTVWDELRRTFGEEPTARECVDDLWREWFGEEER